jgi:flagellar basal-body rod modification protein FlgD
MTPIPPTNSTPPTPASQAERNEGSSLLQDDFLKLFVAQLQRQDPMNPLSDSEFLAQMASFSTVEQVSNVAASNTQIVDSLASSTAITLIGKTVTWTDENDVQQTGVVEKVSTAGGKPLLTVAGVDGVELSLITQVA